jgi:hypothetical protein
MVQKEVRLGSPLFLHFLILYSAYYDEYFFILAYLTFPIVLSHARDTKFVVENFFESSYFSVHMREIHMRFSK